MAASYLTSAEEDLTCPLCFELFVDPHTPIDLNCPHVFCSQCLKKMTDGGRRIISCPECRRKTKVPKDGVSSMKVNLRVRSLAEKHQKFSGTEMKESKGFCPDHKEKTLSIYCVTCDVFACKLCVEHKKLSHDLQDIDTAQHKLRKKLCHSLAQGKRVVTKKEALIQDLLEKENIFRTSLDTEVQKLNKAIAEVLQTSEALKTQLEQAGGLQLKPCLELQTEHRDQIAQIQMAMDEANKALSGGTVSELTENQSKLGAILKSKDAECKEKEVHLGKVRFEKKGGKVDLGRVVTEQKHIEIKKVQQLKKPCGLDTSVLQVAAREEGVVLVGSFLCMEL